MNPYVILAGASLLCFGSATTVSTLIAYTSPANPLGLIIVAVALFVSAGVFGLFSLIWYVAQRAASLGTSVVRKHRYRLVFRLKELEETHLILRIVGLSTLIAPTDQRFPKETVTELLTELRTRYVDGRLTEGEFEEEVTTILEQESELECS